MEKTNSLYTLTPLRISCPSHLGTFTPRAVSADQIVDKEAEDEKAASLNELRRSLQELLLHDIVPLTAVESCAPTSTATAATSTTTTTTVTKAGETQTSALERAQTLNKALSASRVTRGLHSLTWAIVTGHETLARRLIEQRVHVQVEDEHGLSALHHAARRGSVGLLELLVAHGAEINQRGALSECTALHEAARVGHFEAAQWLLQHGADGTLRDADGCTALHHAVKGLHPALVELLSVDGTSVHLADESGATPLHHACMAAYAPCSTPSATAAATDAALRIVATLLARGARPDAPDAAGDTPLHEAALLPSPDAALRLLQLLLTHHPRVSPDVCNDDGATPLHHAALLPSPEPFLLLLTHGASLARVDLDNRTPLQIAPLAWRALLHPHSFATTATTATATTAPVLRLGARPLPPLKARVTLFQTPAETVHVHRTPIQPGFVAEFPAAEATTVMVAQLQDDHYRPLTLTSTTADADATATATATPQEQLLTGHIERVRSSRAVFGALCINTPTHGRIYHLQFFAYEHFGTPHQTLVGFSDRVPIIVVESAASRRDALLRQIWSAALPSNGAATWANLAPALQRQTATLLGPDARSLGSSDVDYLRLRCCSATTADMPATYATTTYATTPQATLSAAASSVAQRVFADACWTWYYGVLKTLTQAPGVLDMWNYGALQGFVTRDYAESLLRSYEPNTLLVRFSDGDPGAFAVGYLGQDLRSVVWAKITPDQLRPDQNLADILADSKMPRFVDSHGIVHDTASFLAQFRSSAVPSSYVTVFQA